MRRTTRQAAVKADASGSAFSSHGEEVERGAQEAGRDPGTGVPEEARLARTGNDLGPLVPALGRVRL